MSEIPITPTVVVPRQANPTEVGEADYGPDLFEKVMAKVDKEFERDSFEQNSQTFPEFDDFQSFSSAKPSSKPWRNSSSSLGVDEFSKQFGSSLGKLAYKHRFLIATPLMVGFGILFFGNLRIANNAGDLRTDRAYSLHRAAGALSVLAVTGAGLTASTLITKKQANEND